MTIYLKDELFYSHNGKPFEIIDGSYGEQNGGGVFKQANVADMILRIIAEHKPIPMMGQVLTFDEVIQKNRVVTQLSKDSEDGYYILDTTDSDVVKKLIKWTIPLLPHNWQLQAGGLIDVFEKAPSERPVHEIT